MCFTASDRQAKLAARSRFRTILSHYFMQGATPPLFFNSLIHTSLCGGVMACILPLLACGLAAAFFVTHV